MADRDPVEIATNALLHRDRSRCDVEERLQRAGVGAAERADALDRLERVGYIDDKRFAGARAGTLADRGYGDEWIRHDLARHGVPDEDAAEALAALEPEAERAAALVAQLGRTTRTGARLARKGFGADTLEAALRLDVAD
jgi:regulatory protein